ncbi:mercuric reductase [Olivibacter sitiensis]|uniref:mercuric reductase n=1 Tax=Olivibacter sitiensis TaxID=376470 RepID=UPI000415BE74|nr:mercuric reductase [Olivibacter sitiensis]
MQQYDVIIIGSGQAGNPLAMKMAKAGRKVALIEKRALGGRCVNDGCIPTKAMISSAKIAYLSKTSATVGIHNKETVIDMPAIKQRKDTIVERFNKGTKRNLARYKDKLDIIMGEATFTGKKELSVAMNDTGETIFLKAELIFINTGTKPLVPDIPGLATSTYLTATTLLELEEVPKRLLIIGAGYIALELGQLFARLGSDVHILEASPDFLDREDRDVANCLLNIMTQEGLHIQTGVHIEKVTQKEKESITLSYRKEKDKRTHTITGTHLLVAAGRVPQTASLKPAASGIKLDGKGYIKVNNRLETNVKGIYALGDVHGGKQFTHLAYNDFAIVYRNLIEGKRLSKRNRLEPYCVYTDPQMAQIGLSEDEAIAKGIPVDIAKLPMKIAARGITTGATQGMMKALVDPKSKKILGACIIAAEAGELISVIQMAMQGGLTAEDIRWSIFVHPSYAETFVTLFNDVL